MKFDDTMPGIDISPFLVSGRIGIKVPALDDWIGRDDVTDVEIIRVGSADSTAESRSYMVVAVGVHLVGATTPTVTWVCTCPNWHFTNHHAGVAVDPAEVESCKHIRDAMADRPDGFDDSERFGPGPDGVACGGDFDGPPPGSDDAVGAGCTCPVLDNGFGAGWRRAGQFVFAGDCPVHSVDGDPHPDVDVGVAGSEGGGSGG